MGSKVGNPIISLNQVRWWENGEGQQEGLGAALGGGVGRGQSETVPGMST